MLGLVNLIKRKAIAYFQLMRVSFSLVAPAMAFSVATAALRRVPDMWVSFVLLSAPWLGSAAGTAANDYFHEEIDRHEKPYRPIPSGRVKPMEAFIFACILGTIGIILTITLFNVICILAAAGAVVLVLMYNSARKIRFLGPIFRAFTEVLLVIYGFAAARGRLTLEVIPLALIFFTDVLSSNTGPASMEDVSADEVEGAVTPAVKLGARRAIKLGMGFLALSMALGFLPFALGYLSLTYLITFLATRFPLVWAHSLLIRYPTQRFGEFAISTHAFTRVGLTLSLMAGVLPLEMGFPLAVSICILTIMAPVAYFDYLKMASLVVKRKE